MEKQNDVNKSWSVVESKIENSTIKRFPWKKILGIALTRYTEKLLLKGHNVREIYEIVLRHTKMKEFIQENKSEIFKIHENLWTTINAQKCESVMKTQVEEELNKFKHNIKNDN
jgi:DNA-binding protein Fis